MCECNGWRNAGCIECGLCLKGDIPADGPDPEMFGAKGESE